MNTKSVQIIFLIYIVHCALGQVTAQNTALWESLYYIREHLFIIVLLLVVNSYLRTYFSKLIIYGLIIYKFELILFNIFLAFLDKKSFDNLCLSYDIAMIFTASIWLISALWLILKKFRKQ